MSEELAIYNSAKESLSLVDVKAQVNLIQDIMQGVMQKDQHFGIIPGTNKPTLLKAGAEKLCLTFRLDPQYDSQQTFDGDHLTVKSKCTLYHIPSGNRLGSGEGSCSTKESKYGYRNANRKCPNCDQETIFTSKKENEGYYCWSKKGGCGKTFAMGDESIEKQKIGKVPNEYVADQYNTVLKMANKRSLIAAVLNVTAASDIFTQDTEDMRPELEVSHTQAPHVETQQPIGAPPVKQADSRRQEEIYKTGKTMITSAKALKSIDATVVWIDSRYAEGKLSFAQATELNELAERARRKF